MAKVNDVNIPVDLIELCQSNIDPSSEEGRLLLPPQEIIHDIREHLAGKEMSPMLEGWLTKQQQAADEAAELTSTLPPFEGGELPGWMGSNWAIRLGCPWGAGLPDAVQEGKMWLATQ